MFGWFKSEEDKLENTLVNEVLKNKISYQITEYYAGDFKIVKYDYGISVQKNGNSIYLRNRSSAGRRLMYHLNVARDRQWKIDEARALKNKIEDVTRMLK